MIICTKLFIKRYCWNKVAANLTPIWLNFQTPKQLLLQWATTQLADTYKEQVPFCWDFCPCRTSHIPFVLHEHYHWQQQLYSHVVPNTWVLNSLDRLSDGIRYSSIVKPKNTWKNTKDRSFRVCCSLSCHPNNLSHFRFDLGSYKFILNQLALLRAKEGCFVVNVGHIRKRNLLCFCNFRFKT